MVAARLMGSCKLQTFSCCPLNNKNHKSLEIPSKFKIPKLLSFTNYKPRSDLKLLSSLKLNGVVDIAIEEVPQQTLSVSILVLDEVGQLRQKIDELVGQGIYESDQQKRINIVLDEVLPLLIENTDSWISSRLTVSSTPEESFHKLRYEEEMDISCVVANLPNSILCTKASSNAEDSFNKLPYDKALDVSCIAANVSNSILCTKVFVDVSIIGVIDDKLKEIHNPGDLKVLLRHLMSMKGVTSATLCVITLLSKEKREALKDYYHATA